SEDSTEAGKGILSGSPYEDHFTASGHGFNPRFVLSYKPSGDALLYAQAARGFRIGGPGARIGPECAADARALGLPLGATPFAPDHLWNYELGAKSTWQENRLLLNASVYYIDWSNIQSNLRLNCGTLVYFNAGAARSRGAELEITAKPLSTLQVMGSLSYSDAKITNLQGAQATAIGAQEGDRLPYAPRLKASVSLQYRTPLSPASDGFAAFTFTHVGDRKSTFESSPLVLDLPAYNTGAVRVGMLRDKWELAVFADNLWNERAVLNAGLYTFHLASILSGGEVTQTAPLRPRTIGLTLRRAL